LECCSLIGVLIMEDLAYIYLALNEEVEPNNAGFSNSADSFPNAWAPAIASDSASYEVASSQLRLAEEAPTQQESDVGFETHSYPSFYL